MKSWATLLLSVLAAVTTVVAIELIRGGSDRSAGELRAPSVDRSDLERRLAALEGGRPPELVGQGLPPNVLERVDELDVRVTALESARPSDPLRPPAPPVDVTSARDVPTSTEEMAPEDLERFRRLRNAALREDRRQKAARWISGALEKAALDLTEGQGEQLVEAYVSFMPRRTEIWGEAKARATEQGGEVDWSVVIRDTHIVLRREFTERIATFLPAQDADLVSAALIGTGEK